MGVPDLVVEAISPPTPQSGSAKSTNRGRKLWEYGQAGVVEYWLVHPTERTIEVYGRRGEVYHRGAVGEQGKQPAPRCSAAWKWR